jgi:FHA domain
MDPVALVDVYDPHGRLAQRLRLTGAGSQLSIGRSLDCDLVIDDAYAAGRHALLELRQDGRLLVRDLGALNGTRVDGREIPAGGETVLSAGELRVGRTLVRVRTHESQLPPERVFKRDLLRRHRTAFAISGFLLCLTFAVLSQWLAAPGQAGPRMLIAVLVTFAVLGVWVGFWSLVARLGIGAWQIRIHLSIAAIFVAICAWGYALLQLLSYMLQWQGLEVAFILAGALLALATAWLHLRNATTYSPGVALVLGALAPLMLGGVLWLAELQLHPRTVNRYDAGPAVYPSLLRFSPSTDLADYLADAESLQRAANRNRQASLLETPLIDD